MLYIMNKTRKRIEKKEDIEFVQSEKSDHFYYNITINNTGTVPILAKFRETRGSIILDDPSQYTLAISRFQVNSGLIPIFNFKPQPGPISGNTNLNKGIYSVTLTYNGVDYQEYIIYDNFVDNFVGALPTNWEQVNDTNFLYYGVYQYQAFIDMINSALQQAYQRIPALAIPKLAGAPAPYLQLNNDNHIISLIAHRTFDSIYVNGQPTISIFMNHDLYSFFHNFEATSLGYNQINGKDILIKVNNEGSNALTLQPVWTPYAKWFSYITYGIGDLVSFNAVNYRSITAGNLNNQPNLSPLNWFPEYTMWSIAVTYLENDIVTYNSSYYRSIANGNIGNQPDISPAFWELTTPNIPPQVWSPAVSYSINNVVFYQGYYYISRTNANLNNLPPTSTANWLIYLAFDVYKMSQEYNSLYNWNDIIGISFSSSTLPIVKEYVPQQGNSTDVGINNSVRAILTDFSISSTTGYDVKEPLTFTNQGEYRLINMDSQTPLSFIDMQIYWIDSQNNYFPIYIDSGKKFYATIKLLFRKKLFNKV